MAPRKEKGQKTKTNKGGCTKIQQKEFEVCIIASFWLSYVAPIFVPVVVTVYTKLHVGCVLEVFCNVFLNYDDFMQQRKW